MPIDVARRGTLDYKDPPLRAIVAANDVYQAGYHNGNPGGLDAIDPDLATANIKNGITIFGKVGSADVHDISDATAVEAEVLAPETFYAVGGGRRTGTMPTVALAPGSSAYPAGYHAGDGGGLPAIDADLVTANIKNGITIFNVAGHVNVRDVSDANALIGEVMNTRTFYAVGGARKTGTLPTQTLNPANQNVLAGYYAATTLSAVDAQLAAANILSGVNIFGFVGVATVQDIADADAVLADVRNGIFFYSVTGGRKTGNMPTVAIAADNNAYPAGYHAGDGGGLSAIDVNLAAANILSGVNIFGFVGVATVQDIADADALVGQVLNPRTFYSVTGARKTGTMATVALAPGSNAYPAGYHVGAANLTAVDGDLVTANIKNGITIFNIAGSVDVRDVSDANALVGEVMNGRTFYAVGGAIKVGTLATRTLNAANEIVQAGYYAATTLSAVDVHLAAANILSGVNIFGFVGPATVQDIADANAVLADVKAGRTFYSVTGGRKTGNLATVAIVAANDNYPAGYHAGDAGGLDAIDVDLAAANIKSGVTIFGKLGTFTNTGAPPAAGDVKNGKVCWANGAQINGTMPTVALAAGSSAYPAGYHAGHGGGLPAIDADLATANIKNGITIFNIPGDVDVRDVSDANALVGEVKTGSTFYAVGGARKTGNGTQTLNPANENVPAGYYALTTLSAVDVQLAVGNIKLGVNIFGFVGTYAGGAIVHDDEGSEVCADPTYRETPWYHETYSIPSLGDVTYFTTTLTCAQATVIHGVGGGSGCAATAVDIKVRLVIDGTQVAESGFLPQDNRSDSWVLVGHKAVSSGARIVRIDGHNYHATLAKAGLISGGVGGGCSKT